MRVKRPARHVLVVVFREDRLDSRTLRIPLWGVRAVGVALVGLVVMGLLGVALYSPVTRAASQVPALHREIDRLRAENAQVDQLAEALDSVEAGYQRLRRMVGADLVPDPSALDQATFVAPGISARLPAMVRYVRETTTPTYWPLEEEGYVTRGASDSAGTGEEAHPGLDIAVRVGSVVRATATGTVVEAGRAGDYGLYVLLRHPGGYESLYGHLSRLTVGAGTEVDAGQVIGLSGNTGRSTAPHLHFELRRDGRSVDPATLVKEES